MGRGGTPRTGGPGMHEAARVLTGWTQGVGKAGWAPAPLEQGGVGWMEGVCCRQCGSSGCGAGCPATRGLGAGSGCGSAGRPTTGPGGGTGGLQAVCARLPIGLHKYRTAMRRPAERRGEAAMPSWNFRMAGRDAHGHLHSQVYVVCDVNANRSPKVMAFRDIVGMSASGL